MMKPPDRNWDYRTDLYGGAYFWFEEMVYMNGYSELKEIRVDTNSGKLLREYRNVGPDTLLKCNKDWTKCEECNAGRTCSRNYFSNDVQEAYKKHCNRVFEKNFESQFVVEQENDS